MDKFEVYVDAVLHPNVASSWKDVKCFMMLSGVRQCFVVVGQDQYNCRLCDVSGNLKKSKV